MIREYEFNLVAASGYLEVRALGLWSHETLDRLEQLFDESAQSKPPHVGLRALVDLSASVTHPRDVTARLQGVTANVVDLFERVAIILPSSALAALQTRRLMSEDEAGKERRRVFGPDDLRAARAWLHDEKGVGATSP